MFAFQLLLRARVCAATGYRWGEGKETLFFWASTEDGLSTTGII